MDTNDSSTILFFDDWYLHRRENLVRHVGRPKLVTEGIFIDPHLDPSWGYPTVFVDANTGSLALSVSGSTRSSIHTARPSDAARRRSHRKR